MALENINSSKLESAMNSLKKIDFKSLQEVDTDLCNCASYWTGAPVAKFRKSTKKMIESYNSILSIANSCDTLLKLTKQYENLKLKKFKNQKLYDGANYLYHHTSGDAQVAAKQERDKYALWIKDNENNMRKLENQASNL